MEAFVCYRHLKFLFTTAANRKECQAQEWWDEAEVIVSMQEDGGHLLRGAEKIAEEDMWGLSLLVVDVMQRELLGELQKRHALN